MNDSEKTSRIGYLCWTMVALGLLFFLFKSNACTLAFHSCNTEKPTVCQDEFYEVKDSYTSHTCTPGARVEIVSSPPAPKAGVLCHCINSDADAAAPVAPPK